MDVKVSICTPTHNRRKYITKLVTYVLEQDYPIENIEWLFFDDGTDKIGDIVDKYDFVKYYHSPTKKPIGFKRNFLNNQTTGDIIINMDDDDIYPKDRISHAVEMLTKNKNYFIAGTSIVNIYYEDIKRTFSFGPYWRNHATAATFAYRKELLKHTQYNNNSEKAEETTFLKKYSFAMLQLDTYKTILVRAHNSNTVDKKKVIPHAKREVNIEELKRYNIDIEYNESGEPII